MFLAVTSNTKEFFSHTIPYLRIFSLVYEMKFIKVIINTENRLFNESVEAVLC